jgi:hypothetical protein
VDGVTVYRILPAELSVIYDALMKSEAPSSPDPPLQFSDFARWEREYITGSTANDDLAFWREQLAGAPPELSWPAMRKRPATETFRGLICKFELGAHLTHKVEQLARQEGVTLFVLLLSSFAALLHRYTLQNDIVVGTLSPWGRKRPELQNLIGHFINPIPLRLRPQSWQSFRTFLHQVHGHAFEAITHDSVNLESLAAAHNGSWMDLGSLRSQKRPLFTACMSLQPRMPDIRRNWSVTPWMLRTVLRGGTYTAHLLKRTAACAAEFNTRRTYFKNPRSELW